MRDKQCGVLSILTIMTFVTIMYTLHRKIRCCEHLRKRLRHAARKINRRRYSNPKYGSFRKHRLQDCNTIQRVKQHRASRARNNKMCVLTMLYVINLAVYATLRFGVPNVYGSEGPRITKRSRYRAAQYFRIVGGNMNSGNTILPFLAQTRAHVVCNQELMYNPQQFWDVKRRLMQGTYRNGTRDTPWRAEGTPSNITDNGGLSGGAMIYTKPAHKICPIPTPEGMDMPDSTRNPYDIIEGRLTGMIIHGRGGKSIMIFSVYMECGDKNSKVNCMIRYTLGLLIASTNLPYVIMGDWQVNPHELAELGWLETIEGYVVAPDEPTCKQEGRNTEGSIIDYAVVSNWVAPRIRHIRVLHDYAYNPHKYVELEMDYSCAVIEELQASKPNDFPTERPIGPCNEIKIEIPSSVEPANLDQHAEAVMDKLDHELLNVMHLEHTMDEHGKSPYIGRKRGMVLKKTTDARDNKPGPWDATAKVESMRSVREALVKTRDYAEKARITRCSDYRKTKNLLHRCVGATRLETVNPQVHTDLIEWAQEADRNRVIDIGTLDRLIEQYTDDIDRGKRDLANERARTYKDFITKAISHKGAQLFHRILKKKTDVVARPVSRSKFFTTADQDHAEEQMDQWAKIWKANPHDQQIGYNQDGALGTRSQWLDKVTRERIADYRRVISTFKTNTAVAYDNLSPRALQHVSDDALRELIALFDRCEYEKRWPEKWRDIIMVMIPKAEAYKWRLIAMLCTYYRIWARRTGEDVSRWMATLDRDWIANGPGKSSEHAIYDIALDAEAHDNDPNGVEVTMMDDLEKGFEKVVHSNLLSKAEIYNFPCSKLPLALSMYTGRRRIRCGKAFSKPVCTTVGVLAGCPIAMGLLLLSIIDPVDRFWKTSPTAMVRLKIYVDDFALNFRFNQREHTTDQMVMCAANAYRTIETAILQQGANFAKGKGKIVASQPALAKQIA